MEITVLTSVVVVGCCCSVAVAAVGGTRHACIVNGNVFIIVNLDIFLVTWEGGPGKC